MEVGLWVAGVVARSIVNGMLEDLDGGLQVGNGQMRHVGELFKIAMWSNRGVWGESGKCKPCQGGVQVLFDPAFS
jgi:hypothetical protein